MSFMSFKEEMWEWEDQAYDFKVMQQAKLLHKAQRKGLHPTHLLMIISLDDEGDRFSGMTEEGWWLSQQVKHFQKWEDHPRVKKHDNRATLTVKQWRYLLTLHREDDAFDAIEEAMDKGLKPRSAVSAVLQTVGNEEGVHYGRRRKR